MFVFCSVSFPTTLQDIENSFINCTNLTNIDLSTANQLECLAGSFKGCSGLTTVTLSENLKEIGEGAFEGCIHLTSLSEIPSVQFIGANAFKETGLTRTPLLNKTDYIAPNAFDTGKPILLDFGEFSWIDDPVQSGEDWFAIYPEVTGVRSANRLSLNALAFALTEKTFAQFPWKNEVEILLLLPSIETFERLPGLNEIKVIDVQKGYKLSSVSRAVFDDNPHLNPETIISSIEKDGALHTIPVQDKSIQVGLVLYGAQVLSAETVRNCKNMSMVRLPDSLGLIENNAFYGCASLKEIDLPHNISEIGEFAFSGCTNLNRLYGVHQITRINENAFGNCPGLGVLQIFSHDDQKAMTGTKKDNLQTAIILQGTESIRADAFRSCFSLGSIVLPSSLQTIGDSCFQECASLFAITLPASLKSIGNSAFGSCSSLVEMNVSKVELSVTNSINWTGVLDSEGCHRITKVICRREQADKIGSVFTRAICVC